LKIIAVLGEYANTRNIPSINEYYSGI
jgi:hypothetical protein